MESSQPRSNLTKLSHARSLGNVRRRSGPSFGGGLAGGWTLAHQGSNPSPSARISPDNTRIKLPRCFYPPSFRESGFLGNWRL